MITNNDQNGNYLVEVFARKARVNTFQAPTRTDAVEEAWKIYRRRAMVTTRQTRKVQICRLWKRPGRGFTVTDVEDITPELRRRWSDEL